MLEREFKYYQDHKEDLIKRYGGKYIVIVGEQVIGKYDTQETAYSESEKKHKVGTFLIQHCAPDADTLIFQRAHFG